MLGENGLKTYQETLELLKSSEIYGCLAGSCMMPSDNREQWEEEPDIDVFCYNEASWVQAIMLLQYKHGFIVGSAKADEKERKQNEWKINKTIHDGINKKNGIRLSTVKLHKDDVTVNISVKQWATSAMDVILTFDQTIIMRAYDIPTGNQFNLSKNPVDNIPTDEISYPNTYRMYDYSIYDTPWYVRQFDRVIKYWNRGINTLPVAKFYLDMINKTIADSDLWESDKYLEDKENFIKEWSPVKDKIENWIKEKEAE